MERRNGRYTGIRLLLVVFLVVGAGWPLRALADAVGVVLVTRGEVLAAREDSVRVLGRRDELFVGDVITTGSGARAQFRLDDGETVTLYGETELHIEAFEFDAESGAGESRKSLVEGGLRAVSGVLSRDNEVETPVATIGVRGTTYMVVHDAAEGSAAGATDGVVNLANARGTDEMDLGEEQDYPYGRVRDPDAPVEGLLERPEVLARLDTEAAGDDDEVEEGEEDGDREDEDDAEAETADEGGEEEGEETDEDGDLTLDEPDGLDDGADEPAGIEIEEELDTDLRDDLELDEQEDLDDVGTGTGTGTGTGRSVLVTGPDGAGGALFAEDLFSESEWKFVDPDDPEHYYESNTGESADSGDTYSWGYWDDDHPVYWLAAAPMDETAVDGLGELAFNSFDTEQDLFGMARTTAAGHFDLEAGTGGVELLFDPQRATVSGRVDLFQENATYTEVWWAEFSGALEGAHTHFDDLDGGFTYLAPDGSGEEISDLAADSHVDILLISEDVAGGGFHLITADQIEALENEIQEAMGIFVIDRR